MYSIYLDKYKGDKKKTEKKISDEKQKVVAKLIFEPYLIKAQNKQNDVNTLGDWLVETPKEELPIVAHKAKSKPKKKVEKKHTKIKKQTNISDFFG